MSRFFATVAAAIAVALLPLSPAGAQSAQQACAADIQTFCAGVPQGEGRVARCLRANQQKLSPSCQSGMRAMADLMKEVVAKCEDDVHRYCAGAAPGTTKYTARCAMCHGADGQGIKAGDSYAMPPLWGPDSFNTGAGTVSACPGPEGKASAASALRWSTTIILAGAVKIVDAAH